MDKEKIENIFIETNAFLKGHFELSSGLHSDAYVQCALVLQYPDIAEKLSKELASFFKDDDISVVIGPALGGVTLAYEIARALGVKGIFAERKNGIMQLRRGFTIKDNDKILVAEDVITTGNSVKEVIALLESMGKEVVGVASLINRSQTDDIFNCKYKALLDLPLIAYEKENCPLCKEGLEIIKPGSKDKK